MTHDIRKILLSSQAVASLSMETRIAKSFKNSGWKAERSVYYTDVDTGKAREIDVRVSHVFEKPQARKGIGAPIINLDVVCECKNLKGSNVVFVAGKEPEIHLSAQDFWIGTDVNLRKIVMDIAREAAIEDKTRIRALYDYAVSRAYAGGEMALRHPIKMPPPPVNLVARAFRETKSGRISGDAVANEGKQVSPVWSAILSVLSSVRAIKQHWGNVILENIRAEDTKFYDIPDFAKYAAFFLDADLMRNVFFHPVVILGAKLWHLENDNLVEVNSARLYIADISGDVNYVDLVSDNEINNYVSILVAHYNKCARRSISGLWRMIDEINWYPGQAENALIKALRPVRKKVIKKHPDLPTNTL